MSKRSRSSDNLQAKSKRLYSAEVKRIILESDEENSGHCSDLETESDDSDVTVDYDAVSPGASTADPGANAGDPGTYTGDTWSKLYGGSTDCTFLSSTAAGPLNLDTSFVADSGALKYFELFFTEDMWIRIRDMTNLRAAQVKASKPKDFYASNWTDVTLDELNAFVGCRLSMEYSVVKRRLEHYFSSKTGFLFATPGYRDIFKRDRFMALWKFLHVCDEG